MIYSIVVGLIAGWLAGQVMKGGGYGVLVDINPRDPWWHRRRLGVRTARTPCGGINRFDYRVVCRRGDSGLDRATGEKGVSISEVKNALPRQGTGRGNAFFYRLS